jgi:hypothetical protein
VFCQEALNAPSGWGCHAEGDEDRGKGLGDDGVAFHPFLRHAEGVQDRRVVAAAEAATDACEAFPAELPAEVHRQATRQGDRSPPRRAHEIVGGQSKVSRGRREDSPGRGLWAAWDGFIRDGGHAVADRDHQSAPQSRGDRFGKFPGAPGILSEAADEAFAGFGDAIEQVREGVELAGGRQFSNPIDQDEFGRRPAAVDIIELFAGSLFEIANKAGVVEKEHIRVPLRCRAVCLSPVPLNVAEDRGRGLSRPEQNERAVVTRLVGEKAGDAKPKKVEFRANHATTVRGWRLCCSTIALVFWEVTTRGGEDACEKTPEHSRYRRRTSASQG